MKRKALILTSLICICGILIYLSCGRDCPVCPKEPEPPELGHYRLYVFDSWNQFLMSVDLPADTIIDSINTGFSGGSIAVTPDGQRLLVNRFDYNSLTGSLEIYNTTDLSHIGSSSQRGSYYFDGSDNYGILKTIDKIYFINPTDLSPIDSVDLNLPTEALLGHCYLDTTSNMFFGRTEPFFFSDSASRIYQIDCKTGNLVDSILTPLNWGRPIEIAYNWLTNDLYFLAFYGSYHSYFYQYDLDGDSLISRTFISHVTGSISVSPDGKRIYMIDGGNGMLGMPPINPIWVFDALTHQPIQWIPWYDSVDEYTREYFGQILLTPDNMRAYLGSNVNAPGGPLVVIDLKESRIIRRIKPFPSFDASVLALGPVPDD